MRFALVTAILTVLSCSLYSQQVIYYVSSSDGNDENTGNNKNAPLLTMQKAAQLIEQSGHDGLTYVSNGVYDNEPWSFEHLSVDFIGEGGSCLRSKSSEDIPALTISNSEDSFIGFQIEIAAHQGPFFLLKDSETLVEDCLFHSLMKTPRSNDVPPTITSPVIEVYGGSVWIERCKMQNFIFGTIDSASFIYVRGKEPRVMFSDCQFQSIQKSEGGSIAVVDPTVMGSATIRAQFCDFSDLQLTDSIKDEKLNNSSGSNSEEFIHQFGGGLFDIRTIMGDGSVLLTRCDFVGHHQISGGMINKQQRLQIIPPSDDDDDQDDGIMPPGFLPFPVLPPYTQPINGWRYGTNCNFNKQVYEDPIMILIYPPPEPRRVYYSTCLTQDEEKVDTISFEQQEQEKQTKKDESQQTTIDQEKEKESKDKEEAKKKSDQWKRDRIPRRKDHSIFSKKNQDGTSDQSQIYYFPTIIAAHIPKSRDFYSRTTPQSNTADDSIKTNVDESLKTIYGEWRGQMLHLWRPKSFEPVPMPTADGRTVCPDDGIIYEKSEQEDSQSLYAPQSIQHSFIKFWEVKDKKEERKQDIEDDYIQKRRKIHERRSNERRSNERWQQYNKQVDQDINKLMTEQNIDSSEYKKEKEINSFMPMPVISIFHDAKIEFLTSSSNNKE